MREDRDWRLALREELTVEVRNVRDFTRSVLRRVRRSDDVDAPSAHTRLLVRPDLVDVDAVLVASGPHTRAGDEALPVVPDGPALLRSFAASVAGHSPFQSTRVWPKPRLGGAGNGRPGVPAGRGREPLWQEVAPWHQRNRRRLLLAGCVIAPLCLLASLLVAGAKHPSALAVRRFSERLGYRKGDVEGLVGETHRVGDVELVVHSIEAPTELEVTSLNPTVAATARHAAAGTRFYVAHLRLTNRSTNSSQQVGPGSFRLETETGQLLRSSIALPQSLRAVELVAGGHIDTEIVFQVPEESTHNYLIYLPSGFVANHRIVIAIDPSVASGDATSTDGSQDGATGSVGSAGASGAGSATVRAGARRTASTAPRSSPTTAERPAPAAAGGCPDNC